MCLVPRSLESHGGESSRTVSSHDGPTTRMTFGDAVEFLDVYPALTRAHQGWRDRAMTETPPLLDAADLFGFQDPAASAPGETEAAV